MIAAFVILIVILLLQQWQIYKLWRYCYEIDHIILGVIEATGTEEAMGIKKDDQCDCNCG